MKSPVYINIYSKSYQIQYSFSDPTSTIVKYCISSRLTVNDFFLSFSNIIHCSLMFKLVLVVKYCISSKLTVNDFFLSFSNIIHCSLMFKLVLVVKYCISSKLTVYNFFLSFSILYPLLVSVPALSVVFTLH